MPEMPEHHYFLQRFERALQLLNDAQKSAVETLDGPVLVLAGPGTGKTHILSARIGLILRDTDTQPHNILCLTYTDAGVFAMRQRLLELIGPAAHQVHIFTFHAFCNRVIQENPRHFGRRDLQPVSSLEKVEIIRELLDQQPPDHLLKQSGYADPYLFEQALTGLFDTMKSEDWSAARIRDEAKGYLESLPQRSDFRYQRKQGQFQKGDLKINKIQEEEERMARLIAAAELFDGFEALMARRRRYDYADMIGWVLKAFDQKPFLLRRYQEQYLYFLVDEYQDTNGAQNAILQHLLDYWDNPNVFIVGDDDQSIYEFQGARLQYLRDFHERYREHLQLVVLEQNYRSVQPILDWAHRLIERNKQRIVYQLIDQHITKNLVASLPEYQGQAGNLRILEYPDRQQELTGLVEELAALHASGFPLEEVAVIYPRHSQAIDLMHLLQHRGIPFEARKPVNVLNMPLIRRLLLLLEYVQAELQQPHSGEAQLFRLLHHSYWQIPTRELAELSIRRAEQTPRPAWRTLLAEADMPGSEAFREAGNTLEHLLRVLANQSLTELLEACLNRTGMLREVLDSPNLTQELQALQTFLRFVNEELLRQPQLSLGMLLELVERMHANKLSLPLFLNGTATRGVQLVTAHSSKGLEFRRVYLFDLVNSEWESRRAPGGTKFYLPDTLTHSNETDAEETQRRLFYVAVTRAREGLCLSYARLDYQQRKLQRTRYLDELDPIRELTREASVPEDVLTQARILQLQQSALPSIDPFDRDQIGRLLEQFTLSVTAFNQFLRCPLSFFYQQVLRVPVRESHSASFGQAMHEALEAFFQQGSLGAKPQMPILDFLLNTFEEAFRRKRALFTEPVFDTRLQAGLRYLEGYYHQYADTWPGPGEYLAESHIVQVQVDGVPLRGTIDRIDFTDLGTVRLIDYKTGRLDKKKISPSDEKQPEGGSYWRQLVFYKILFEAQQRWPHVARSGVVSFLEPDKRGHYPEQELHFSPEQVLQVRQQIKTVYQRILDQDFYQGCGESSCPWCTFVRERRPVEHLSDPDIEALDD
jgi:DNA helicase-2/ATP-dependent DNA helicase PcrA